ncbi:epoxyqueuosine reductase QueH, partial [bacterium]|nr:epoxyqueuosine reductase QueH [bacterium]
MQNKPKILIHTCCAICSGYPISYLKDLGYEVCAYFYNPNIYPLEEYQKRLEAQTVLC